MDNSANVCMAKTIKESDTAITQRVAFHTCIHVHVKIDTKEMENSVKVCIAKAIKRL